ncbi:hypothetical protein K440DRAFT_645213 [Wilcoxina mikolae CBS 423.85]|nr:hypothetical protein K440DRAFT_645213 [Wilcoxina mikolae CBS 423.85]
MDRNIDVLWQIVLTLISLPHPCALFNFLAAHPVAFALFQYHSRPPLTKRTSHLETHLFKRVLHAYEAANAAMDAAEIALDAAHSVQSAANTTEEAEAATVLARSATAQAATARKKGRDAREALAVIMELKETVVRKPEGNEVMDEEFWETCESLAAWRRFRGEFFRAAAVVAVPRNPPEVMNEEFKKAIRKRGPEEFALSWRREFFGLRLRRSKRIKMMKGAGR